MVRGEEERSVTTIRRGRKAKNSSRCVAEGGIGRERPVAEDRKKKARQVASIRVGTVGLVASTWQAIATARAIRRSVRGGYVAEDAQRLGSR
jgi:hypothetical protein